jgi:predicted DNA-binding ribbon-helix-helix protein
LAKRSITVAGHRTSISLEDSFWQALGEIAGERRKSVAALIAEIDRRRAGADSLSSAIRVFVLERFRGTAGGR